MLNLIGHWFLRAKHKPEPVRCLVCNRKLTAQASVDRGIGPTCAKHTSSTLTAHQRLLEQLNKEEMLDDG